MGKLPRPPAQLLMPPVHVSVYHNSGYIEGHSYRSCLYSKTVQEFQLNSSSFCYELCLFKIHPLSCERSTKISQIQSRSFSGVCLESQILYRRYLILFFWGFFFFYKLNVQNSMKKVPLPFSVMDTVHQMRCCTMDYFFEIKLSKHSL